MMLKEVSELLSQVSGTVKMGRRQEEKGWEPVEQAFHFA